MSNPSGVPASLDRPLSILIIGAGIAGLSAAITLRRVGHRVVLYERSSLHHEIGAAIIVPPNAARALLPLGFDPVRARLVVSKGNYLADGDSLVVRHAVDARNLEHTFGAPLWLAHRVDLHSELKRLATQPETDDAPGYPAVMVLRSEVVGFDTASATITFADGSTASGDLVVAADGVHSRAATAVLGTDKPAPVQVTDTFVYRFLMPTATLLEFPETRRFMQGAKADGYIRSFVGKRKRLVWYPCRNNEEQNFVCIFWGGEKVIHGDWKKAVDKSEALKLYHDFHPDILKIIDKAKDVKQWPLLSREPLASWHSQRLVLLGDAAHPMLPFQGQGGAQAIEDGIALGIALSGLPAADADVLEHRLTLFERIRLRRASILQIFSSKPQDQAEEMHQRAAQFMPLEEVPNSPEAFMQFNFSHDVVRESDELLSRECPGWSLPRGFVLAASSTKKLPKPVSGTGENGGVDGGERVPTKGEEDVAAS